MRLIDADKLEVVSFTIPSDMDEASYLAGANFILNEIDRLPTVDAEPVVHAKWMTEKGRKYRKTCSNCNDLYLGWFPPKRCPHCGAKMDKEG